MFELLPGRRLELPGRLAPLPGRDGICNWVGGARPAPMTYPVGAYMGFGCGPAGGPITKPAAICGWPIAEIGGPSTGVPAI
jgi:hypothetical protein